MGQFLTSMSDFGSSLIFREICLVERLGSVWAVSPHFWALFGQFLDKKDRLDCPIDLCKLLSISEL